MKKVEKREKVRFCKVPVDYYLAWCSKPRAVGTNLCPECFERRWGHEDARADRESSRRALELLARKKEGEAKMKTKEEIMKEANHEITIKVGPKTLAAIQARCRAANVALAGVRVRWDMTPEDYVVLLVKDATADVIPENSLVVGSAGARPGSTPTEKVDPAPSSLEGKLTEYARSRFPFSFTSEQARKAIGMSGATRSQRHVAHSTLSRLFGKGILARPRRGLYILAKEGSGNPVSRPVPSAPTKPGPAKVRRRGSPRRRDHVEIDATCDAILRALKGSPKPLFIAEIMRAAGLVGVAPAKFYYCLTKLSSRGAVMQESTLPGAAWLATEKGAGEDSSRAYDAATRELQPLEDIARKAREQEANGQLSHSERG